jgi:uncharacterized membrane protein
MISERDQALKTIVHLMHEHELGYHEIAEAAGCEGIIHNNYSSILRYLLAYTGGILLLAGLSYYVSLVWEEMGSALRILITLGPGVIAQILGIAATRDSRFQHTATPLLIIAAFFQPGGLFTFIGEYFKGFAPSLGAMLVFGVMSVQQFLIFTRYRSTIYLIFTSVFATAFLCNVMYELDFKSDLIAVIIGLSGLFYSYGLHKTVYYKLSPFGYFLYLLAFALGLLDIVEGHFPIDVIVLPPVALLFFLASIYTASRAMLVMAVLQSLGYLSYFTEEYFQNVAGWPLALMLAGGIMIGISGYAVKLGQRLNTRKALY